MRSANGFSLIELMVAVVIVGILASIAVPAYSNYTIRGKIPEATTNLASRRVQMEQSFQDARTYESGVGCTAASSQYFDYSCTGAGAPSKTSYTITAQGKGSMQGFRYTINESNAQGSNISSPAPADWRATSTTCWITKQGGAC